MVLGAICYFCWGKRGTQEAQYFIHTYIHTFTYNSIRTIMHAYIHTLSVLLCRPLFIYLCIYFGQAKQNICVHSLIGWQNIAHKRNFPLWIVKIFISAVYSQVWEKFSAEVHNIATRRWSEQTGVLPDESCFLESVLWLV